MAALKHSMYYAVKTAGIILVAFLVAVCLFFGYLFYCNIVEMEVPTLGPYQIYVVLSDSMAPLLRVDDAVVINTSAPAGELAAGDVIAFYAFESNVIITHRITGAEQTAAGYEFSTKGDNNNIEDNFTTPQDRVIGKYVSKIPGLARFMTFSVERPYFIALLVLAVIGAQFLLNIAEKKLMPEHKKKLKENEEKSREKQAKAKNEGSAGNDEDKNL